MTEANLDDIAYQLKRNKDNGQPGAIVFLGAGVSVTAGIPQADKIAEEILWKFKEAPSIKKLEQKDQIYSRLMGCITPHDRKELLSGYISSAKINVAHIYLAHLMHQGYVDYIVTVNFDNLTLRALSLFNEFPATYDISILKEITTTTLDNPAVIFMHGQHHGLWQLNTSDEMAKIKATAPHIFRQIADRRPWIVVGYGATDPVFDHLVNLGRFDNQLFWVSYKDNEPASHIRERLLDNSNSGAYWVKGFDADSFFLRLNTELKLTRPDILDKPFSHLKKLQESVVDVQQDMNLKDVHERMTITGKWIQDAIEKYEQLNEDSISKTDIEADQLQLELINRIDEGNFENIVEVEKRISNVNNQEAYASLLSILYNNWGNVLSDLAKTKTGEDAVLLYQGSIDKYKHATELKSDLYQGFYNWGTVLADFAKTKNGEEAAALFQKAINMYQRAIELKPDNSEAVNNWGTALLNIASTKTPEEVEELYKQAIDMFQHAIELKPDNSKAIYNWGKALSNLGKTKKGEEATTLYQQAISKYQRVTELKSDNKEAFSDWSAMLLYLAQTKTGEEKTKLLIDAKNIAKKAYQLGSSSYNLACANAQLNNIYDALQYLEEALSKNEITTEQVMTDADWDNFTDKQTLTALLDKYKN